MQGRHREKHFNCDRYGESQLSFKENGLINDISIKYYAFLQCNNCLVPVTCEAIIAISFLDTIVETFLKCINHALNMHVQNDHSASRLDKKSRELVTMGI